MAQNPRFAANAVPLTSSTVAPTAVALQRSPGTVGEEPLASRIDNAATNGASEME